jgi:hypothetical protein
MSAKKSKMRKVVFDIETSNSFQEAGSNNVTDLNISLVAIHDSLTNEYDSFLVDDFPRLWKILEKTDMLIGFNSDHFDIPLLNKYYPGDLTQIKSLDILKEIKESYGRRMKLDQIGEGTLGERKIGHGLQAVTWWKNGEVEKVRKYCIDDVRLTKEVYDYARKHKKLFFAEGGAKIKIPLDTSHWEDEELQSMTHTLPF